MDELHSNEQYFFGSDTLNQLATFLEGWENPCCICCPMLGKELESRGVDVTILDIDERFSSLKGFKKYDLLRPEWIRKKFGIIVCDPPFYNLSLSKLSYALRMLSQHDFTQPMMVSYLKRRQKIVLRTFSKFNLQPSGFFPSYQTIQDCPKNEIEFFSNIPTRLHQQFSL
jgi:hypothetical protein